MKLRVAELMAERGLTAYALARDSGGRISRSTAYRLMDGTKDVLRIEEIAALCEVLNVAPSDLFKQEPVKGKRGRG